MIVVIGAGIAGLACADELSRRGQEVIVLEARARLGGRCKTDTSLGAPVDLGASWIHGVEHNPLMRLARRYACDVEPMPYQDLALYDGSGKLSDEVRDEALSFEGKLESWCERLCHRHPKRSADISIAAALAQDLDRRGDRVKLKEPRIFDWALYLKGLNEGADLGDLTLRYHEDDAPFEGGDVLFKRGYEELIDELAAGLDVRLEEHVERVERHDEGCRVVTRRGVFEAERVVVTLPLGVLKRGDVIFEPPLPETTLRAIEGLKMGMLEKIAVRFERAFWDDHAVLGKLSGPYRHAGWMLNLNRVLGEPILVGFVAAPQRVTIQRERDEEILNAFLGDLHACFGDAVGRVEGYVVTRWIDDPYARGSYSYIPVGSSGVYRDDLARPVEGRIYFAGEATERDHPATAHGALISGQRVAEMIARWAH